MLARIALSRLVGSARSDRLPVSVYEPPSADMFRTSAESTERVSCSRCSGTPSPCLTMWSVTSLGSALPSAMASAISSASALNILATWMFEPPTASSIKSTRQEPAGSPSRCAST